MADTVASQPGAMSGIMEKLKGWLSENPRVAKSLMAGLGSAAVGGGLTAMSKRKNETPEERRKRILKNALIAGGAGAGAVGLGDYALGQFKTLDPEVTDPIMGPARNIAALVGGGGAALTANTVSKLEQDASRRGIISGVKSELDGAGARNKVLNPAGKRMQDIAKTVPEADGKNIKRIFTGGASSKALTDMAKVKGNPGEASPLEHLLKSRGVTAKDLERAGHVAPWQGKGDTMRYLKALGKRELNTTLGTGKLQRAGRLGAIGASAAIPYAVISKLMDNPELAENTLGHFKKIEQPGIFRSK